MYFAKVAASLGKKDKDDEAATDSKKVWLQYKDIVAIQFILNISYKTVNHTANIFYLYSTVKVE